MIFSFARRVLLISNCFALLFLGFRRTTTLGRVSDLPLLFPYVNDDDDDAFENLTSLKTKNVCNLESL